MARRSTSRRRVPALVSVLVAATACARPIGTPTTSAEAPAKTPIEHVLFLLGDAGGTDEHDAVLQALTDAVSSTPELSTVVFLGDNLYPDGLPPEVDRRFAEAERRLMAQVTAARGAGRTVFIPGNHDWSQQGRADDWIALRRQDERLRREGLHLTPRAGCPGPETVDLGTRTRLVALDTEWWLHGQPTPALEIGCPARTAGEVLDLLEAAVSDTGGRHVIIAGHHPPVSAGPHGGVFDWQDHLFPLREFRRWLWLPLPLVGSAYPLARIAGASVQDQGHPAYERMVEALAGRLRPHAPLLFASGHEHQLNVFSGERAGTRYTAVSGAGMTGHERDAVGRRDNLRFASRGPGFMRLDIYVTGPARLSVTVVSGGGAEMVWSTWLR